MVSLESFLSTSAIQLGLGLLALGLLFGAALSRRARVEPLGYWPLAWAVLVGIGAMRVAGVPTVFEYAGSAIYCALLLAGAYRYADRPIPGPLFPVASVVAIGTLFLASVGASPILAYGVLVLPPVAILAAAVLVQRAVQQRNASFLHRTVPIGLILIAAVAIYDHIVLERAADSLGLWLVVAIPVATNQAVAVFDRIRDRADGAATELEQSVSLLRATLESTADGILVVDRDGRYRSHNALFRTMWGLPEEVVDAGISERVLQLAKRQLKEPEAFYERVKAIYERPEMESFDTLSFKDGRCVERYSRPQTVGEKIVGRVWSFRDVTARKRAEETALRDKDHLEELVSERTRELVQSRDRLRQADRMVAIGTLAAGVAHQINNPVAAILNSAEYALLCADDEDAKGVFHDALVVNVEEAKRCGAIVRGMLQFSRQEPVEKVEEDLNTVIRRALKAVESYAVDRGAALHTALSDEPIRLWMSPLEMEQVVVNLLRNAIESRATGASVSVSSAPSSPPSTGPPSTGSACFKISDNGFGIYESDRVRIFDPFFSTKLQQGGTGLGLSVSHGIVSDHGGDIRVATSPEKGTTITVALPAESRVESDAS